MKLRQQPTVVQVIWGVLALALIVALATARWSLAFVSVATLVLSLLPGIVVKRLDVRLPVSFLALITVFVFSTIFLGEVFDFYERYWWWDVLLHGGSAVAFGLIGLLFVLFLFEGDRYAAPPWALAMIAFTFAVSIGAVWEVFEFAMDQLFGLNMQKSGLTDTMWDLIVDMAGGLLGSVAGFLYLKGREIGLSSRMLREFITGNRRFFRKFR
ncbi:hypothetical protein [Actibacterium sp. MT2.3-13A]|uniref:hypothetical protein n=1 Tax=Actibacterium sp. MT2.3-13A TaxID=2828332 RepID=UPI001BAC3A86|nr:hypothetical protein [Actibacterium sp. MT2.3-13A]